MYAPFARAPLSALSLLTLLACGSGKVEVGDGTPDTGDAPAPSSPYKADSRAGCTYDLAWDEGTDGTDQWWSVTTWDPRVDEDGEWYVTSYVYETELADITAETYSYDDLLCTLTAQIEETVEGVKTGSRTTYTCDASGYAITADTDVWDGSAWADESTGTYTNTYDESGRLIERTHQSSSDDGSLPDYTVRYVYVWSGDLLTQVEYYIGAEEEEALYYTIDYLYGDDELLDTVRLVLGDYFDSLSGTLYVVTEYTWDAQGNPATRDYENVYSQDDDEHEVWTWDEHGRLLTAEAWSEADNIHTITSATWDEEHYRYTTLSYVDLIDATEDYVQTYSYDGGWPWAGTALREYADASKADGTYTFAYTCD